MINPNPTEAKILKSRSQYQACHISVPDLDNRLSAIRVGNKYYSFFKVIPNSAKAFEVAARLVKRGDEPVITQTAKGYILWVWEPEAFIETPEEQATHANHSPRANSLTIETTKNYQPCYIRVPDLEQPLVAISAKGAYYSLFKVEKNQGHATEILKQLIHRGDQALLTETPKGYAVWVLEPEAKLASNES